VIEIVAVADVAVAVADAVAAGCAAVVVVVAGFEVGVVVVDAAADHPGLIAYCLVHRFPTS